MDYLRYVAYAVALIGVALKRRFVLEQGEGGVTVCGFCMGALFPNTADGDAG